MTTQTPARLTIVPIILLTMSGCATYDLDRPPPSANSRSHACPANSVPVCKVSNSTRIRTATKMYSCNCEAIR